MYGISMTTNEILSESRSVTNSLVLRQANRRKMKNIFAFYLEIDRLMLNTRAV